MACSTCNSGDACGCNSNYKEKDFGSRQVWTTGTVGGPGTNIFVFADPSIEDVATALFQLRRRGRASGDGVRDGDHEARRGVLHSVSCVQRTGVEMAFSRSGAAAAVSRGSSAGGWAASAAGSPEAFRSELVAQRKGDAAGGWFPQETYGVDKIDCNADENNCKALAAAIDEKMDDVETLKEAMAPVQASYKNCTQN